MSMYHTGKEGGGGMDISSKAMVGVKPQVDDHHTTPNTAGSASKEGATDDGSFVAIRHQGCWQLHGHPATPDEANGKNDGNGGGSTAAEGGQDGEC